MEPRTRGPASARRSPPGPAKVPVRTTPEAHLEQARARIVLAQQCLLAPNAEALDRCSSCLRAVGDHLKSFSRALAKPGKAEKKALLASAASVRAELLHLNTMLQRAATMYLGWIERLSASKCGYTRKGAPARLTCSQQYVIKG